MWARVFDKLSDLVFECVQCLRNWVSWDVTGSRVP